MKICDYCNGLCRKSFKELLKIALSTVGIIGSVSTIIIRGGLPLYLSILVLVVVILGYVIGKAMAKLRGDIPIINLSARVLRCALPEDLEQIAKLQTQFYPNDAVPFNKYKEWYEANPSGFFVMEDEEKGIVGHITMLAVREPILRKYKMGVIKETDIEGSDLFGIKERDQIDHIYVESVICAAEFKMAFSEAVARSFDSMMAIFADYKNLKTVYAMAATDRGEGLLNRFAFEEIGTADERKDKHKMCQIAFPKFIERLNKLESRLEITALKKGLDRSK